MDPMNIKRGFFYAHIGWICTQQPEASLEKEVDVSDVKKDFWASLQTNTYYVLAVLSGYVLPTVIAAQWGDPMVRPYYW
jgi:stearoyl-CoA desaturase (delta-9 desaturase)